MKLFKRIYYPVMALLAVLTITFGFIGSGSSGAPKTAANDTAVAEAVAFSQTLSGDETRHAFDAEGTKGALNVIKAELQKEAKLLAGTVEVTVNKDGYDEAPVISGTDGKPAPTLVVQKAKPMSDTVQKISPKDHKIVYIDKTVQNLAVYIPGTDTRSGNTAADVLLVSVRYDAIDPEATNAAVAGALVSLAKKLAGETPAYKNDLLFVFADAGTEHAIGLYTFLYQFKGFNGVAKRIKTAVDFDSRSNRGPLMMYEAQGNASDALGTYAKINSFAETNSFTNTLIEGESHAGAAAASLGIPALSFANIGNLRDERTSKDNSENLSESVVRAHAEMMSKVIGSFGSEDIAAYPDGQETAVYFNYFGWFTVAYPALAAMLLTLLVAGLVAGIIVINIKKKAFSLVKALLGALIQILAAAGAMVALYLVYLISSLLLAGFGVITIGAAVSFSYMNPGMIVSAFFIFGAVMCAFYVLLKKSFMVKAPDVVRGNVLLTALAAIVVSFVVPAASYLFMLFAVLELAVMLAVVIFKDKFKQKFGMDIERLFLYVWPAVILMPLLIPAISLSATLSSIIMLPILLLMFALFAGSILPFADYLKPAIDRCFKKLPARSIRYEKEVTEMVEDKAKKGKFTSVTSKKIFKEKIPWNYKNRVGIITLAFLASVSMLLFSAFSGGYEAKIVSQRVTADSYFYNGALAYVYANDSGSVSETFEVRDKQAYLYIAEAITGMKWNAEKDAYEKSTSLSNVSLSAMAPYAERSDKRVVYRGVLGRVKLTVTGAKNTESFTFNHGANHPSITEYPEETEYTYKNNGADEITFYLPYSYDSYITVDYTGGSNLVFQFEEQSFNAQNINADTNNDVRNLLQMYAEDLTVNTRISMIYRTSLTV